MKDENTPSQQGVSYVRTLRVGPSIQSCHQCDVCYPILKAVLHLAEQQEISPGQQSYLCNSCGRAFWVSGDLDQIPRQQSRKTFSDMEEGQAPSVKSHRSEKAITCPENEDDILDSPALFQHHATQDGKTYRSAECEEAIHTEQDNDKYSECGEAFSHKDTCNQHQNMKMGDECNECGEFSDCSSSLIVHQGLHTKPRPFNCDACEKSFVKKSSLVLHQRSHTGAKPYMCKVCGKAFGRTDVLLRHWKIHSGEKPYSCGICGKNFRRKDGLNEHQKLHNEEKPYKCDQCGKCFRTISYVQVHRKIHSGARPYVCNECGKAYITRARLNKHRKVHTAARSVDEVNVEETTEDTPTLPGP